MLGIKQLGADFFNSHDQIAIIVQKSNDMDTCACACALAELINDRFQGEKKVSIFGIYGKSKFLTELRKYDNSPLDWSQDTMVILSEVNNEKQVPKGCMEHIKKASCVLLIDHHKESHEELFKQFEAPEKYVLHDSSMTSACEVLFNAIKDKEKEWCGFGGFPKRVMEILFMGLYSDTKSLASESVSATTFYNVAEMINKGDLHAGSIIQQLNHKPIENILLFADTMKDAVKEKKLIFISLDPRSVYKHIPKMMIKGKDGSIRQKVLLTYIPRWVEQYANVNTIVFVHYSLHKPYDSFKKFVYVILVKANPGLEHLLKTLNFKQNRNRWSREMDFYELKETMNRYKELFTA